ncbi:MAG: hypothetical protein U0841_26630 [Chloroflexia bacterium]
MTPPDDHDGPCKEALEAYLPEIIAFFFSETNRDIAESGAKVVGTQELGRSRRTGSRVRNMG